MDQKFKKFQKNGENKKTAEKSNLNEIMEEELPTEKSTSLASLTEYKEENGIRRHLMKKLDEQY